MSVNEMTKEVSNIDMQLTSVGEYIVGLQVGLVVEVKALVPPHVLKLWLGSARVCSLYEKLVFMPHFLGIVVDAMDSKLPTSL